MVIKEIHLKRLETLVKFIEQKATEGNIVLKRKEVAEVVGVSEGDSLKAVFKLLNENPELYSERITYEKEGRENIFGIAEQNLFICNQSVGLDFNNVLKSPNEDKYLTYLSATKLSELWDEQIITYNPETQRGRREKVDKSGNVIEEDVCSKKNIEEIALRICNGNYCTDTIVLNASNCILTYNSTDQNLTLQKDEQSEFNILDGQHRIKSIRLAIEIIPDLIENGTIPKDRIPNLDELYFPVQIETLTIELAQNAFSQFTKGLKISTTRSEYLDNTSETNTFLKDVISHSNYNGKVEIIKDSIKNTDKLVSFGTLTNAFKESFKEEDIDTSLRSYLIKYFNILEDIISSSENNEDTMLKENITYYGYLAMAKKLYNKEISLDKNVIKNLLSKVDFNKESETWFGKVLLQGKRGLSITNKKDTRKYVAQVFSDLI